MRPLNSLALVAVLALPAHYASAQDATATPPAATTRSVTDALRALVPAGVTVAELRQEGEVYVFTGASATNSLLSDFMRKTMTAPGLGNVELREIAADGAQYRYEMSIKVDCDVPGARKPGAACGAPAKPQSVHKCRINGTLTYQAAPCPAGSDA